MNKFYKPIFLFSFIFLVNDSFGMVNCRDSFNRDYAIKTGNPLNQGFDASKLALIDKIIESDVRNGFPGAEVLIMRNGVIVKHTAYGYKNRYSISGKKLKNPTPMTCNTIFDLASNTKMYATNYALQHLVFQGKINLESPLSYYIPEYIGCNESGACRENITIRQLLSHMSGYPISVPFYDFDKLSKYGESTLYSQESNLTKHIAVTQLPFKQKSDNKPNYSDIDFILLGILVEKVTGENLDIYLNDTIYRPLGLNKTFFNPLQSGLAPKFCAATEIDGNTRGGLINFSNIRHNTLQCQVHDEIAYYSMGGVSGHAGLFSSAHDLAILMQLMLNNGKLGKFELWDKEVADEFTHPLNIDSSYALGWRLSGDYANKYKYFGSYASNRAYGHTGWVGTFTLIDPDYNLVIIILTNKKHSPINLGRFSGDNFATGKYYPLVDVIYSSLMN